MNCLLPERLHFLSHKAVSRISHPKCFRLKTSYYERESSKCLCATHCASKPAVFAGDLLSILTHVVTFMVSIWWYLVRIWAATQAIQGYYVIFIRPSRPVQEYITRPLHSFSILSDDRSKTSSKTIPPHSEN